MIRILRPTRPTDLVSARVFETLFARHLGAQFSVRRVSLAPWCEAVLGPPSAPYRLADAAGRFTAATSGVDFFCPSYECIALAPLLVALRNYARAQVRLLLIAHAPGAYALEWALLRPLLTPGDVIIAPSESARATIEFLCPELARHVAVIPHPMAPLAARRSVARRESARHPLVSLGRISPGKLLHRQVEALAALRARGGDVPELRVAGPLTEGGTSDAHAYARSLMEKTRRLGLTERVRFLGEVRAEARKARLLQNAALLLNLSVTVEESFGKSAVEALGAGTPVVATRWDGLPEVVGDCGALVPVIAADGGAAVDVTPEAVADAIERVRAAPPGAEKCRERAARFAPDVVMPRYRAALEDAMARSAAHVAALRWPDATAAAAPDGGLLGAVPPLTSLSWAELFALHGESCAEVRARWRGGTSPAPSDGERLRGLLLAATREPVERFLAGLPDSSGGAAARAGGILTARLACLLDAAAAGRADALAAGLEQLEREGVRGRGMDYLRVEAARLAGDLERAYRLCVLALEHASPGEAEAYRVRQLAKVTRAAGTPELALPWLRAWLERFPDSPDSGAVWLERFANASRAGVGSLGEAEEALGRARRLLGDGAVVRKAAADLAARLAAAALAVASHEHVPHEPAPHESVPREPAPRESTAHAARA